MPTFEEWKAANPGASDELIRRQMALDAGGSSRSKPSEPAAPGIFARARGAVASGINAVNSLGGTIPQSVVDIGNRSSMIPSEAVNPVPDTAGGVAALAASLAANKLTGGAPGAGPAAARVLAPVAAGAVPDTMLEQDPIQNALWRTLWGGGAEAVAGATGAIRRMMGASRLQQGDLERTADAVSIPGRTVQPTAEDLRAAGTSKRAVGNPRSNTSLEAVAENKFKDVIDQVGPIAGTKIDFNLPNGTQGNLKKALDAYANLRAAGANQGEPKPGEGDARAMAEGLWQHITSKLVNSGLPDLQILASRLQLARMDLGMDMSRQRLVTHATTGTTIAEKNLAPIVDPKTGKIDMAAVQQRFLQLNDTPMVDQAVAPHLESAVMRGGRQPGQPLTDQPGQFAPGMWSRLSPEGIPTFGFHPGAILKSRFPQFVGTPENLAPVAPIQGQTRQLMSLGSMATGEEFKRRLKGAP